MTLRHLYVLFLMLAVPLTAQQKARSGETSDTPHGEIHHHIYTTTRGINLPEAKEDYFVYTPPGYDLDTLKKYPALYLLHGFKQDASAWQSDGNVGLVLDDLIARGKAQPMIVVMPRGYGNNKFLLGGDKVWAFPKLIDQNIDLFSRMLLDEIIPQVDSQYRVSKKRQDRAIAGLSMGGSEAITIGLANTDKFDWIGGFSAAFPDPYRVRLPHIDTDKSDVRLVWMSCGVRDPYFIGKKDQLIEAYLKQQGLPVTTVVTEGKHEWTVWEPNFEEFAQLIFQPK